MPDARPPADQEPRRARILRSRVATRLAERPLRDLGVLGAVLVLGSTAAFGGLEPADVEDVATLTPATTTTAAPVEITLDKVLWTDELPGVVLEDERNRWVAVTATVTNTHTESLYRTELDDVVALLDVPGLVRPPEPGTDRVSASTVLHLLDGSPLGPVQPGLDYEAVFLFEQSGDVAPPTEAGVALVGRTWRSWSWQDGHAWLDPEVVARATLPVREAIDTSGDEGDA